MFVLMFMFILMFIFTALVSSCSCWNIQKPTIHPDSEDLLSDSGSDSTTNIFRSHLRPAFSPEQGPAVVALSVGLIRGNGAYFPHLTP